MEKSGPLPMVVSLKILDIKIILVFPHTSNPSFRGHLRVYY